MHKGLTDAGWDLSNKPDAGDILLVDLPGHREPAAVIAVGNKRVVSLTRYGVSFWPPRRILAAWSPARG